MASHVQSPRGSAEVLSAAATGITGLIESRRLCPDKVFGRVELDPRNLESPTSRIYLKQYCEILELSAKLSGDESIGLEYGQNFKPQMLGLIGYIGLSSSTMLSAAENIAKYFHFHQQETITTFTYSERLCRLSYRIESAQIRERRQDAVVTLGMFVNLFRECAGPSWCPDEVHFEHSVVENRREIEAAFGAPVRFDQPANALLFKPEKARRAMPNADLRLLDLLCSNLMTVGMPETFPDLIDKVRSIIRRNIGSSGLDLRFVANALSVPHWTLQRCLAKDNYNFAQLVDQMRRQVAGEHILGRDLQIGQIAELVGYSEVSAFTRAFKRWYQLSPADYRRENHGLGQRRGMASSA
jgi:AraC-like DNA-binding protein